MSSSSQLTASGSGRGAHSPVAAQCSPMASSKPAEADPKRVAKEAAKERERQEKEERERREKERKDKERADKREKKERKEKEKWDAKKLNEQSKQAYESGTGKPVMHKKQSTWANIKRFNNALANGLMDDVPNSSKIVSCVLRHPAALMFLAGSPVSLRLIERPQLMKKWATNVEDWDALLSDMKALKGCYAELERDLDELDRTEGLRILSIPLNDRQRDQLAREVFQVQQLGCYVHKKEPELLELLHRNWRLLVSHYDVLRACGLDNMQNLLVRHEIEVRVEHRRVAAKSNSKDSKDSNGASPASLLHGEVDELLQKDRREQFDLNNQRQLMRLTLLSATERDHFLLWSFHCLLLDRRSALAVFRLGLQSDLAKQLQPSTQQPQKTAGQQGLKDSVKKSDDTKKADKPEKKEKKAASTSQLADSKADTIVIPTVPAASSTSQLPSHSFSAVSLSSPATTGVPAAASASGSTLSNPMNSSTSTTDESSDEEELADRQFWREYLTQSTPLSLDRIATLARPAADHTLQMRREQQPLEVATLKSLQLLAAAERLPMQSVVLAALVTVFYRWTGERDFVIGVELVSSKTQHQHGTNNNNSSSSSSSGLPEIGNNVAMLPLRVRLQPDMTYLALARSVDQTLAQLLNRRRLALGDIQDLVPDLTYQLTELTAAVCFDDSSAALSLAAESQHMPPIVRELVDQVACDTAPLALHVLHPAGSGGSKAAAVPQSPQLEMHFDSARFERFVVQSVLGNCATVMRSATLSGANQTLSLLSVLPSEDIDTMLVRYNATNVAHSSALVHQLFEAQVLATPRHVALVSGQTGEQLTYLELNRRANRLSHYLRSIGVAPGAMCAIFLPRCVEIYVAMFAIMKAGGAYVPLDTELPKDRLKFILKDAKASHLLMRSSSMGQFKIRKKSRVVLLDELTAELAKQSDENPPPITIPSTELTIYIRYTSGSTGQPKGVEVVHNGVVNFASSVRRTPGITASDTMFALATLSFDISEMEMLMPLTCGAKAYIVPPDANTDGKRLREELRKAQCTIMQATPATWNLLLDAGWEGDRKMRAYCGGEPLTNALTRRLLPRVESLWNLYGPTECSVWCSVRQITERDLAALPPTSSMPVGGPVGNTQFYLLDENKQPVPRGAHGELYIGGEGVARGYFRRPPLTKERFLLNPLANGPYPPNVITSTARMYRTGDVMRYHAEGSMQFVARVDFQVKIRGFRIELGEIEAVLMQHADVRNAVVNVYEPTEGDKRLVAYFLSKEPRHVPSADQLRALCAQKLPKYMVPGVYMHLERFPFTSTNKVDRKALPLPTSEDASAAVVRSDKPFMAPRDDVEQHIAEIFQDVLSYSPVGLHDDFFELGGQSMVGVHLIGAIEIAFQVTVPFSALLHHSTVESLAKLVRDKQQEQKAAQPAEPTPLVTLQPNGTKPPVYCVHPAFNSCLCYGSLAFHLSRHSVPFYGLEPRRKYDTMVEMAAHYVEAVRKHNPTGPYRIAGWSFGCTVAYEMVWQLRRDGHVVQLYLIDGRPPIHTAEDLARNNDALQLVVMFRGLKHYLGKSLNLSYTKLASLSEDKRLFYIMDESIKGKVLPENLAPEVGIAFFTRFRTDFVENEELLRAYHPQKYDGRVVLLRAADHYELEGVPDPLIEEKDWGWSRLARDVDVTIVPDCDHDTIVFKPVAERLADILAGALQREEPLLGLHNGSNGNGSNGSDKST